MRNCEGVDGCNYESDPASAPEENTNYYGSGFFQRISTHHAHQQFDWVISNNLLSHSTVAWDRWFMGGNHLSAGANWPQRLWEGTTSPTGGIVAQDAGPPSMRFNGGSVPYTPIGLEAWPRFGFEKNDRWQFSSDITWVKGRHAIKSGFEFRHHNFPSRGWAGGATGGNFNFDRLGTAGFDAAGNNLNQTGDPFASFLLGQVHASNQNIPVFHTFRETYTALFISDEFKVSDKLTVTAGMRFDYESARTERENQYSTFSPTTPNPGAGGIPGAMIFAGEGPGRSGQTKFEDVPKDAFGPRLGFAYRIDDKQALRGGYGIYYANVAFNQGGAPTQGFGSAPFAPNNTNGIFPAHHLDAGFPADRVQFPPFIDPTINIGGNVIAVNPDGLTLPRFQNWSVTYQRQLSGSMMFDHLLHRESRQPAEPPLADVWRRREHERSQCAARWVRRCCRPTSTPTWPVTRASRRRIRDSPATSPRRCGCTRSTSKSNGAETRLAGANTTRRKWYWSVGSRVVCRRASRYTYSHLMNNGAEVGQGGDGRNAGIQNPADPLPWLLSDDDTPHVVLSGFTWEVPGPTAGAMKHVLGGWNVSGVLRYESGRPMTITMTNDLGGLLFNTQKRPNQVGEGMADFGDFDPFTDRYYNRDGWADPGPLQFGNAPERDGQVRGFRNFSEDINFFKVFPLTDQKKLRFEAQVGNLFNRTVYCNPASNWSGTDFGQVFTQCNTARSVQLGFRFDF